MIINLIKMFNIIMNNYLFNDVGSNFIQTNAINSPIKFE